MSGHNNPDQDTNKNKPSEFQVPQENEIAPQKKRSDNDSVEVKGDTPTSIDEEKDQSTDSPLRDSHEDH